MIDAKKVFDLYLNQSGGNHLQAALKLATIVQNTDRIEFCYKEALVAMIREASLV